MLVAVGGIEDHIHMVFHLPPTRALADVMRVLKTNSSGWMNDHKKGFAWQGGYGAFRGKRLQPRESGQLHSYQELHHRKMSFEEEYVGLLRKHGVDFDPRFVFD
jgi:REP element-mobilizing transposase RayT